MIKVTGYDALGRKDSASWRCRAADIAELFADVLKDEAFGHIVTMVVEQCPELYRFEGWTGNEVGGGMCIYTRNA